MANYRSRRTNSSRRRDNRLGIILLAILVIICIIGLICFFAKSQQASDDSAQESVPANDSSASIAPTSTDTDASTKDNQSAIVANAGDKTPVQNEGTNPNLSETITGIVSYASTTSDKAIIRINIDQFITAGTCNILMTNGDLSYSDIANVMADASTSTCAGFDIPLSKLSSGTWNITVNISSGDKTGIISGKIDI